MICQDIVDSGYNVKGKLRIERLRIKNKLIQKYQISFAKFLKIKEMARHKIGRINAKEEMKKLK